MFSSWVKVYLEWFDRLHVYTCRKKNSLDGKKHPLMSKVIIAFVTFGSLAVNILLTVLACSFTMNSKRGQFSLEAFSSNWTQWWVENHHTPASGSSERNTLIQQHRCLSEKMSSRGHMLSYGIKTSSLISDIMKHELHVLNDWHPAACFCTSMCDSSHIQHLQPHAQGHSLDPRTRTCR